MSLLSNKISRFYYFIALLFLVGFSTPSFASEAETDTTEFNASEVILHHVLDDHIWHFWDGHYGTLYLPVIVYSSEKGLDIFSSHNFYDEHHNLVEFNGYKLEHSHITLADSGKAVLDVSITKNVAMLLINATLLLIVFFSVANAYKKNVGKAPKGIQSFFEPIIVFVRDEIVKPNIGHHYEKYLPYLLTLFFFILFGNFLGLLPGAGNMTGNIAVTLTLAVFTFILTNVSGNKAYWGHIFWTPGVPLALRPIIMLVEVIGIFTKPFH
jgi:F-type H+-transporting ATPase subunit a